MNQTRTLLRTLLLRNFTRRTRGSMRRKCKQSSNRAGRVLETFNRCICCCMYYMWWTCAFEWTVVCFVWSEPEILELKFYLTSLPVSVARRAKIFHRASTAHSREKEGKVGKNNNCASVANFLPRPRATHFSSLRCLVAIFAVPPRQAVTGCD